MCDRRPEHKFDPDSVMINVSLVEDAKDENADSLSDGKSQFSEHGISTLESMTISKEDYHQRQIKLEQ